MAYESPELQLARIEERLKAQDARETDRERLLRFLISEAVLASVEPLAGRVTSLERDRERVKAYGAAVVFLAGLAAWAVERLS